MSDQAPNQESKRSLAHRIAVDALLPVGYIDAERIIKVVDAIIDAAIEESSSSPEDIREIILDSINRYAGVGDDD
jgi:hypothetical protein